VKAVGLSLTVLFLGRGGIAGWVRFTFHDMRMKAATEKKMAWLGFALSVRLGLGLSLFLIIPFHLYFVSFPGSGFFPAGNKTHVMWFSLVQLELGCDGWRMNVAEETRRRDDGLIFFLFLWAVIFALFLTK